MLLSTIAIYFISEIVIATEQKSYKGIEELEKEKNDLFKQINEAIGDSVKSLQKANDSDSLIGLKYMKDLKEHMIRVNVTATNINHTVKDKRFADDLENRRKLKKIFNPSKFYTNRTPHKDIIDFEAVLKPKKVSVTERRETLENRRKMQKQLEQWILEREKEKDRLKQYKLKKKHKMLMSGVYEKCPEFGYKGNKNKEIVYSVKRLNCKKKISDTDFEEGPNNCTNNNDKNNKKDDKPRRTEPSRNTKYPCCRKCCKKSYLGCL
ncbi:unnamed protein product, partial [Brenthis ino]